MDSLNKTEQKFLKNLLKTDISRVNYYLKNSKEKPVDAEYSERQSKHIARLEKELVMLNKLMDKLEV